MRQAIKDLVPATTNFVKIENLSSPIDEAYISGKLGEVTADKIWLRGGKIDGQSGTTRYALIRLPSDNVDDVVSRLHELKWQGRVIRVFEVGPNGYADMLFGINPTALGVPDTNVEQSDQKPVVTAGQTSSLEGAQSRTLAIREDDSTSQNSTPGGESSRNGGAGKRRAANSISEESHSVKRSRFRR